MLNRKLSTALSSVTMLFCASAAFAESPVQKGETLESLSKVKIETTINGQAGSFAQMGIPSNVVAQAIAQNAVIDVQAQTLTVNQSASPSSSVATTPQLQTGNLSADVQHQINQTAVAVPADIEQIDPNAAALPATEQNLVNPDAQAQPTQTQPMNDVQQLGDVEPNVATPLQ